MKYECLSLTIQPYECKICGYTWIPNKKGVASKPKTCANRPCRSRLWERGLYNWKKYEQEPIKCYYSESGCLIVTSHTRGKKKIYHHIAREGKQWLLHRWVFYIYNGYEPSVVMHTCDNTDCINPLHLIAGTREENEKDKLMKGRTLRGEKNPRSKLKTKDIFKIKNLLYENKSNIYISKLYNVSPSAIHLIKIKKNWRYV